MAQNTQLFPPADVRPIVEEIARILKKRGETVATSEAACGGLISAYLVSVPGASSYYMGGTLGYSLKSRLKLGGWSEKDIALYTGPSEDVAKKLARNMLMELGSTYALSETAWAGPFTGKNNEDDSKVGTAYYGISASSKLESSTVRHTGIKDRTENMALMAKLALEYFLEYLKSIENEAAE